MALTASCESRSSMSPWHVAGRRCIQRAASSRQRRRIIWREGVSWLKTTPFRCFHSCQQQSKTKVEAELGGSPGQQPLTRTASMVPSAPKGGPNRAPKSLGKGAPGDQVLCSLHRDREKRAATLADVQDMLTEEGVSGLNSAKREEPAEEFNARGRTAPPRRMAQLQLARLRSRLACRARRSGGARRASLSE